MTTVVPSRRPRGPNGWLAIGGVFTVLAIAVGSLSAAGWLGFRTETQDETYRQEVTKISLDVGTGDLTLAPGDAGAVAVHRRLFWSYSKPTIDEHWDGSTLRVTARCRALVSLGPGCGVDYTVAVPEGIAVEAHTSTGDVSVRNIRGHLRLSTSTGDITASGITSTDVEVSTSTGDIDIRFTEPPQAVAARASTGDVTVSLPEREAYRVQADASTGDVHVNVRQDGDATRSVVIRTSTGDIDVSYG